MNTQVISIRQLCLSSSILFTAACMQTALAADYQVLSRSGERAANSVAEYWTPERLANARELPLPEPAAGFDFQQELEKMATMAGGTQPAFEDGGKPTVKVKPDLKNRLFEPTDNNLPSAQSGIAPAAAGTFEAHYTSSRLVPLSADLSYPYRTVGKLFFTIPPGTGVDPPGDYVCSASVIKQRVILTAGHCVHSGSNGVNGWFTNWQFVPAFRDGAAPFQTWSWSQVNVTNTWFTGGGVVPNAADYAMIVAPDQVVNGVVRKIGQVTGWLGWQTLSLSPNHAHLLGYPCNIDSCGKMHQVAAGSFRDVAPNNVEYGSDMRGGSSGGPWVQNFGVKGVGQPAANLNLGLNRVIGVTSYGYISNDPKVQGSAILDQRFINLLNIACAGPGNC
jgi:V8-like Glu-specific endopeptidase